MATLKFKQWKTLEDRVVTDCLRLKTPCFKVPEKIIIVRGKPIRQKTPFDFFAVLNSGKSVVFDAKKTEDSQFLFSKYVSPKCKQFHQFIALNSFSNSNAFSGYLVWFSNDHVIGFITINQIRDAMTQGEIKLTLDKIKTIPDTSLIDLEYFYAVNN